MRPRDLADFEAGERGVAELDEPDAEPIPAAGRNVLDVARGRERGEQPRDGARIHAGSARQLVRPELAPGLRECVQEDERTLHGGDAADGWSTRARHARLSRSKFATRLPRRQ